MGVVGKQHFRLMGASVRFQRDAEGSTNFPWIDFGVVEPAAPTLEPETAVVEDASSGLRREVDSALTKITESYDFVIRNLGLDNLSMLYYGNRPSAFTQTAGQSIVTHRTFVGEIGQIVDSDGDPVFGLASIAGIYTGSVDSTTNDVTAISSSGKTLTLDVAVTLSDGDQIIVTDSSGDLTNKLNATTYTVDGAHSSVTTVNLVETPAADESAIDVDLIIPSSGTIFDLNTDWKVKSLDDGTFNILSAADSGLDDAQVSIVYLTGAITGSRLINPQDITGEIKGTGIITYGMENNGRKMHRRARMNITPSSAEYSVTDFSNITLNARILSDTSLSVPSGVLVETKGTLPTLT